MRIFICFSIIHVKPVKASGNEPKTNEYMSTASNETEVLHPEGKILLMNGNILDCYPKAEASDDIRQYGLELDTTGEFFSVRNMPAKTPGKTGEEPWMALFYKEAFFLYDHRDRIMSDSRMFLTPLPFQNNLAYSGTSGLSDATLGVYLEWWETCERSVIKKDGEIHALTYYLAGSPLTGINRCNAVTRDGITEKVSFSGSFADLWCPFMTINKRYTEAKGIYQAYSLEETHAILRSHF